MKNTPFIPTKETLTDVRAGLKSSWRPPIIKKDEEKQEKIYEEMNNPLAKLKQETVEYAEKISREQEDGVRHIILLMMRWKMGMSCRFDDGEMSLQKVGPKLAYHYPDPHPKRDHQKLTQGPIPISPRSESRSGLRDLRPSNID